MDRLILTITACLAALFFVFVRVKKGGVYALVCKAFASFCFIVLAMVGVLKAANVTSMLIVLGLICGLIGDILLDLKVVYTKDENKYLNFGMLFFASGHLLFLTAILLMLSITNSLLLSLVISAAVGVLLTVVIYFASKKMGLDYGKFKWQTITYCFLLVFLSAFSVYLCTVDIKFLAFCIGIILFFASDLVLSMQYFGGKQQSKIFIVINHVLYYAAQISVASFIFMI